MPRSLDRDWSRFLTRHFLVGTATSVAVFVGIVTTDALGLAELAARDRDGVLALVLLWFGLWITFCSVAMGTAIMSVGPDDDDDQGPPRRKIPLGPPAPVRVGAQGGRRR